MSVTTMIGDPAVPNGDTRQWGGIAVGNVAVVDIQSTRPPNVVGKGATAGATSTVANMGEAFFSQSNGVSETRLLTPASSHQRKTLAAVR